MATAYTAKLEEMDFDVKDWMLRIIPRAMGVCVCLRDDALDLTVEQVREKIAHVTPYYGEKITECLNKIELYENMSDAHWEELRLQHNCLQQDDFAKRKQEIELKRKKYTEAIDKLNALRPQDDLGHGAVKFAKEQIYSTLNFDCYEVAEGVLYADWKTMKDTLTAQAHKDYAYNCEAQAKELDRVQSRVAAYDRYIEFIGKAME